MCMPLRVEEALSTQVDKVTHYWLRITAGWYLSPDTPVHVCEAEVAG